MIRQYKTNHFDQFCKGDWLSTKAIYTQCFPQIKSWVLKNSGNTEDAKDIFQEGLIVLVGYCKKDFTFKTNICSFLYGICSRIWLKQLRKKNKKPVTNIDISEYRNIPLAIDTHEEQLRYAHCLRVLNDLLNSMKERERMALKQFYIEGKGDKEIAENLGFKNANTIKVQRFKYLIKLRTLASKHPDFNEFCFQLFL